VRRAGQPRFSDRHSKNFFSRKFKMIQPTTSAQTGRGGLTRLASSGISHAQAGLAKLRPLLPSTIRSVKSAPPPGDGDAVCALPSEGAASHPVILHTTTLRSEHVSVTGTVKFFNETKGYVTVNARFPASQPLQLWPDVNGTMHQFQTTAQWQAFATAMGDFVAATDLGQTPAQPVTIP
jgi:hypothetical protein